MVKVPKALVQQRRFWERVDVGAPDACWPWTGSGLPKGYGRARFGSETVYTHRLAWMLANGPIPDGLWVLHRCDNPPCCNPAHLYAGTPMENVADRELRFYGGLRKPAPKVRIRPFHPRTHLTDQQVNEIRERLGNGDRKRAIAGEYGVTGDYVYRLSRNLYRAAATEGQS